MKILQLSNKSPWPVCEGGPIAMNALIVGLREAGHEVHVLTMSTPKFPVDTDQIPADYAARTNYCAVRVDNRLRVKDAFRNLFTRRSYNIERFVSAEYEQALIARLEAHQYDVVLLESLYVASYTAAIRAHSKARIILRAHNVEHQIWTRLAAACRNPLTKLYMRLLAKRLQRFETAMIPQMDGIAAITDRDEAFFRTHAGAAKVSVVPFGILPSSYIFSPQDGRGISLCHIGSMDWMPNTEGIRWFLDKCWPGLRTVYPDLRLVLAGRNMPDWLIRRHEAGVDVVGEVEDAHAFMTKHPVMVVPLLSGSGVRVKIIEAMALGRTVITTSIGAEGIRYTKGEHLLVADSPVGFYEHIKTCIKDPEACARIGENARALIETGHNCHIATAALLDLIRSL